MSQEVDRAMLERIASQKATALAIKSIRARGLHLKGYALTAEEIAVFKQTVAELADHYEELLYAEGWTRVLNTDGTYSHFSKGDF